MTVTHATLAPTFLTALDHGIGVSDQWKTKDVLMQEAKKHNLHQHNPGTHLKYNPYIMFFEPAPRCLTPQLAATRCPRVGPRHSPALFANHKAIVYLSRCCRCSALKWPMLAELDEYHFLIHVQAERSARKSDLHAAFQ